MKKIKVVNRVKFLRFIVIVLVFIAIAISFTVSSKGLDSKKLSFVDQFEKTEITVKEGQTSWDIQKTLTPNFDVRKVLYFAESLNDRKMGEVKAGETLIFLKEK